GEIVEEAVLNHRANGDLRFWKQALHGLGHQVGTGVANDVDAVAVAIGDYRQFAIAVNNVGSIDQSAINPPGKRRARQTWTNGSRHVSHADRCFKDPLTSVRQDDCWHDIPVVKNDTNENESGGICPSDS